ncbi:MAG: PD-(D/E)XK nuclease family protein [Candidatus Pacebacteria bacterium]|nr:PD-(D/E)XK nuclease family protein [Candidatus Paceibacterota bacterium]
MTKATETDHQAAVRDVLSFLREVGEQAQVPRILLRRGLNETWFSDMLSWLLDVNGSHGFGTAFANEFLKRIAQIRTYGTDGQDDYSHRKKFLKWEKVSTAGTHATHFSLRNSATFREFYLSNFTQNVCQPFRILFFVASVEKPPCPSF